MILGLTLIYSLLVLTPINKLFIIKQTTLTDIALPACLYVYALLTQILKSGGNPYNLKYSTGVSLRMRDVITNVQLPPPPASKHGDIPSRAPVLLYEINGNLH